MVLVLMVTVFEALGVMEPCVPHTRPLAVAAGTADTVWG